MTATIETMGLLREAIHPPCAPAGAGRLRRLAPWLTVLALLGGPLAGERSPRLRFDPAKDLTQYVHDRWQEEDGLPPHAVLDVLRTRDGYLWLATRGGLLRFDGVRFVPFNMENTPIFASDHLSALAEDLDGNLWVGTAGAGLLRYGGRGFSAHQVDDPAGNAVDDLLVDRSGVLWIGTRGGLYRIHDGEPQAAALAGFRVTAIYQDADGALWIGTENRGLFRRRDGRFEPVGGPETLSGTWIRAIHRDGAGRLWVSGRSLGLLSRDDGGWRQWGLDEGLLSLDVFSLGEDDAGRMWLATEEGLQRARRGSFDDFGEGGGLTDSRLRSFHADTEGNLWIGSYSGLDRLRDGFITTWSAAEAERTAVWAIYEDRRDRLWITTMDGELYRFEEGELRPYPPRGFRPTHIYSILEARDGTFWLGTREGLAHAVGDVWRLYTTDDGLPADSVRVVLEDPAAPGELWLGLERAGLVHWRGGVMARYGRATGLSDDRVRFVHKASPAPGDLWIGTEHGLNRLRDGRITVFTAADGISGEFLTWSYEDAAGHRWFLSRGGGMMRFEGGRFIPYTTRDGLPTNDVWSMLDDEESLWLSSDGGIFRIRKDDVDAYDAGRIAKLPANLYGTSDGMKTTECNAGGSPSSFKRRDGSLWFPTMAGAVEIDPVARQRLWRPPPVVIESLIADGLEIDLGGRLELAPGQHDLELRYTALNLHSPKKLRFRRRLEGYDADWVDAGHRRLATYTNLPPGTYTFRIIAGDEGVWSDPGASLTFTLRPHLYQIRGFQVLAVVTLVLVIAGGVRLRLHRIRRRTALLQAEVEQRQHAEAKLAQVVNQLERTVGELEQTNLELEHKNEEMERFTYTVSHDLKSPLLTVQGFLGFLERDLAAGDAKRVGEDVGHLRDAVAKMQRLIDDLLVLARVGRDAEAFEEVAWDEVVDEALQALSAMIDARRAEIVVAADLPRVVGERTQLVQLAQNLIGNAVKYMGDEPAPRVEVGAIRDGDETVFFVSDNGMGIEPRYHEVIFGLFERLSANVEGSGVGLALVKRIVERHGGRIWVESEGGGKGSTFRFTLPRKS